MGEDQLAAGRPWLPIYASLPRSRRESPVRRPKLAEFSAIIDAIPDVDQAEPRMQGATPLRPVERIASGHASGAVRAGARSTSSRPSPMPCWVFVSSTPEP